LLTLSSSALGLSLAFIKDIVPLARALWLPLLYASWVLFVLCIVATLASFQVSIAAQNKHLFFLQKYYLEGKREFFNKKTGWSEALDWFT